jgi:hypothetical protein
MQHGDAMTRKGMGLGKFEPGGSVSLPRLFFRSASEKLARLDNACAGVRTTVDPSGSTSSKVWSGGRRKRSELEGQGS